VSAASSPEPSLHAGFEEDQTLLTEVLRAVVATNDGERALELLDRAVALGGVG
jgi:hypothetical protein